MAPLPHNNTDIYYLDYNVGGVDHTLENRVENTVTAADASTAFSDLLTALSSDLFELNVIGMRKQVKNSNISFPVTYSGLTAFGSGTPTDSQVPQFFSYTGRSLDGRRWKVTVFGAQGDDMGGDLRQPITAATPFQDGWDAIDAAEGQWLSISESDVYVNNYINFGWNAYWQRQRRIV